MPLDNKAISDICTAYLFDAFVSVNAETLLHETIRLLLHDEIEAEFQKLKENGKAMERENRVLCGDAGWPVMPDEAEE